jgi:hypothetical protein
VSSSYRSPPITISAWLTSRARADSTSNSYVFNPYRTNAFGDDLAGRSGALSDHRRCRQGHTDPLAQHFGTGPSSMTCQGVEAILKLSNVTVSAVGSSLPA